MSEDIFTRVQRNPQRLGEGAIKWGDVEGEATREAQARAELRLPAPVSRFNIVAPDEKAAIGAMNITLV
jgi:hypothetical protein